MDARYIKRRKTGSNIAEFAPALLVLLFMFFPLIDFLGICASYGIAAYCNYAIIRELACRTAADGGGSNPGVGALTTNSLGAGVPVYDDVVTNGIKTTGFWSFLGASSITCTATYVNPPQATAAFNLPAGAQPIVQCTTTVQAVPIFSVPWIPGLSDGVPFTITSQRPREVLQ